MPKGYSEHYDAVYDTEKLIWLESKCADPDCDYCSNRPEYPTLDEQGWLIEDK